MRALMVEVIAPCRPQSAGMAQGREQVLFEVCGLVATSQ